MTPTLVMWSHVALLSTAHGQVPDWTEDFDAYNDATFSGTNGWVSGYSGDTWSTANSDAVHNLDENLFLCSGWGTNNCFSNFLVQTNQVWEDFILDVDLFNEDNDTIGLVFRWTSNDDYYLVYWTHDGRPTVGGNVTTNSDSARLFSIRNGQAHEIASFPSGQYIVGQWHAARVSAVGDQIDVWLDENQDGIFAASERAFSVTDTDHTSGNIGLYAFASGGGSYNAMFDNVAVTIVDGDLDGDTVPDTEDNCPGVANPDQEDLDLDGLGDACDPDADDDGLPTPDDCDDLDAATGGPATWYLDGDGDNWGDSDLPTTACIAPTGHVVQGGDCDDQQVLVNPGAPEICDDLDNDCDGDTDEEGGSLWYVDPDGDGYAALGAASVEACEVPPNHAALLGDCDEGNPAIHPGAAEIPDNGIDENCDGIVDDQGGPGPGPGTGGDDDPPPSMGGQPPSTVGCGCAQGPLPFAGGPMVLGLALMAIVRRGSRAR